MAAPRKRRNDAKLEAFAQEMAKGRSAVEAAKTAGYLGSSLASNAKKRAQLPSVKIRIAELRRAAAANTVVTVERLIDNAEEARLMAMSIEQPGAANQCIQTMAKLSGVWIDKGDLKVDGKRDLSDLSTAELLARTDRILAAVEAGDRGAPAGEN